MASGGAYGDARMEMRQALREIREALHAHREGVVTAVMRRNRAQDMAAGLEKSLIELDDRIALAERVQNARLAAELRAERKRRAVELTDAQREANALTAAAEAAKVGLPEEEARLLQRARELQTRLIEMAGSALGPDAEMFPSDADESFERARGKTKDLLNEASARSEVSAARSGEPGHALSSPTERPAQQSADQMLAALEARLGLTTGTGGDRPAGATPATDSPAPPADSPVTAPAADVTLNTRPPSAEAPRPAAEWSEPPVAQRLPEPAARSARTPQSDPEGARAGMDPTQRVRIAAVGTGNIFRGAHLPAYPDIAQAQLVALCDPDPQAQRLTLRRYHELMEARLKQAYEKGDNDTAERLERDRDAIQVVNDLSEVIEKIKPDLVDICTQPVLHAPLSIQALEAGLNVMCEKPISRSWLESQRVIEAARRSGCLYQHNENWLWDPDWYTAKKLVDAGAIGEPLLMFLATAHGGPEGAGKFWNSDFGGGGALLDNGIHAIGASWYVSSLDKRPTFVKAAQPFGMSIRMPNRILDGRFQKVRVDDDAHILIRFENPDTLEWSTAHVEGSWSHRDSPDTVVIGSTGRIQFVTEEGRRYAVVLDSYEHESRRIQVSGPTWQHWPSSFYGEILNMVECVRHGVPSISDAGFGAECSAIVGAAYLSERDSRRAVHVDEFKSFARSIADRYPGDPSGADDALVEALLSAVRRS